MKVKIKMLRRIILILAIFIIRGIVVMLILLSNPLDNRIKYIYSKQEGTISQMPKNVSSLFAEYNGLTNQRSIYKAMYIFVNDIVEEYYLKFKDDFNKEKIEKYYDKNALEIKTELGIMEKYVFVDFINNLSNLKGNELKLKEYIIIPESITQVVRATRCVLAVEYENNNRILFELDLLNSSDESKTPINYKAADSTYSDYNLDTENEEVVVDNTERPGKIIE